LGKLPRAIATIVAYKPRPQTPKPDPVRLVPTPFGSCPFGSCVRLAPESKPRCRPRCVRDGGIVRRPRPGPPAATLPRYERRRREHRNGGTAALHRDATGGGDAVRSASSAPARSLLLPHSHSIFPPTKIL
jgi:hypothetical protein